MKIIIAALQAYESKLEKGVFRTVTSDRKGKLPFETSVVADLYDKAQKAIYGKPVDRLFPNFDKSE